MPVRRIILPLCVLVLTTVAVAKPTARQLRARQREIKAAIAKGTAFLLSQFTDAGPVKQEYDGSYSHHPYGGQTALTVYALLSAGVPSDRPELQRALHWLMKAKLTGTYSVSLRAMALSVWNNPQGMALLRKDTQWLIDAAGPDGGYTYTSKAGRAGGQSDNSNSQFALLGVWSAAQRGVPVPRSYWQLEENYWLGQQHADGGWAYRPKDKRQSYGSMTAAGLASLFIIRDAIHQRDYLAGTVKREYEPISKAMKWLETKFRADRNPVSGHWWYYWLYSIERVAMASGYKYFGNHDWYAAGAELLLKQQDRKGYWDGTSTLHNTNFAILFLSRGQYPVLVNKLKYRGRWNARPRDIANFTRWLSWNFERPVGWQVVDIDAPMDQMQDAPILYISGAGVCQFSDEQVAKLRRYVLRGGLIVSEAAANSGDFTLDMQRYYRRMLPSRDIVRVDKSKPLYLHSSTPAGIAGLLEISNGIRPLVIHSPRQLSQALQAGYNAADKNNKAVFDLLANIYLHSTDKGTLLARGASYWPTALHYKPVATIKLVPLKYKGNYDPEPLALRRLAIAFGNRYSVRLDIGPYTDIADLDAARCSLAVMTGTGAFTLTKDQASALRRFFLTGGTLIIDAAGGSRDFDRAVYNQILPLPKDAVDNPLPPDHPIFHWPNPAGTASYRRDFARALGPAGKQHMLRAVYCDKRLAIIYSPADLTAGLVGYQLSGLRGYKPKTALALMTNIVFYAARSARPTEAPPKTTPATRPATADGRATSERATSGQGAK